MSKIKCVVVDYDLVTAYGWGIDAVWKGLLSGTTAIKKINRFPTEQFFSQNGATIAGIEIKKDESLIMQMLRPLLHKSEALIPRDASLILSTTVGEIDILERFILGERPNGEESSPDHLLEKIKKLCVLEDRGMLISAACVSSGVALAEGASKISRGERDCVLVVACDSVSEFVFSGFSSLMALDKEMARPFDKNRAGLSIGEAAGFVLLMSEDRALKEKRLSLAQISGWGMASDANHMSGPSRDGSGLALAIKKSFSSCGITSRDIGSISAHGTGTVYNDSMEIKAFQSVFGKRKIPAYSIKGGTGHTMGAAGLIETVIAITALKEKVIPPTVNLNEIDQEAKGWVLKEALCHEHKITLSTNSGFGGLNCALVIKI